MKEFITSQSAIVKVDDEDYDRVMKYKWSFFGGIVRRYSSETIYIPHRKEVLKHIPLASYVMQTELIYDHRDRDGLNNQKYNLRECSYSQNTINTKKRSNCSSKYKGVSWAPRQKKWQANIRKDGKLIYLGYHEKEEDAALAYNKKGLELFGEFMVLNIV